jgi:DnaJ-class molecular chaperone
MDKQNELEKPPRYCRHCGGWGKVRVLNDDKTTPSYVTCPECKGTRDDAGDKR